MKELIKSLESDAEVLKGIIVYSQRKQLELLRIFNKWSIDYVSSPNFDSFVINMSREKKTESDALSSLQVVMGVLNEYDLKRL